MAEAMVYLVLQKITATLGQEAVKSILSHYGKEASALLEVQNNMRQLEIEFKVMKAFLMHAEMRPSHNLAYQAWLDEIKVSYDAEDVIDEYAYLIAQTEESRLPKKLWRHSKNINGWRRIADELKQIEARLLKLSSMKNRYGISTSGEGSYTRHNSLQEYTLDTTCVGIEDNIVGIEEESTWLLNQLIHGHVQRIIISLWGMGGLGKTTLVLSVSQSYNVDELLRKILKQLLEKEKCNRDEFDIMDTPKLIERMTTYLQDKRYLIVLDDLWSRDAWVLLDPALVRNNNGSRIIITTRIEDVASLAYDEHYIQLKTLGEEEAWDLFCRKAFPRLEGKACPQSLIHWAKDIVNKCEGLPLAIVAIGSLMSRKKLYESEWKSFYHQLDWQLTNNPDLSSVTSALDLSINHLQGYLKNCFLYCGIFPEDYQIGREELIQLWIAESFIEERGLSITMGEVADEYLKELVQRSLLQVVERDANGRADTFQMHDLVRDLVVSKCKSGKFSILLDDARVTEQSREVRRVSVLNSGSIIDHLEGGEKIRSFLLFDRHVPSSWVKDATGNFKLLRVLPLRFANIKTLPDVVTTLFNLHYLDLFGTNLKLIPKALCKLRKLQLLDLDYTSIVDLPLEISRLTKLRVLSTYVEHDIDARIFDCFQAAKVPPGICSLKDLQVLGYIELTKDIAVNLGNLTLMRYLSLMKVKDEHMKHLWTSIIRMPYLSRLTIISYAKEEVLNLESLQPLPNLDYLYLKGKLQGGVLPPIFASLTKLQDLCMGWSRMQTDPIPSFSHMLNLVELHLYRVYEGQMMIFRGGWFPKLKRLYLADMEQLNAIEMEAGTMQTINYVKLIGLRSMLAVPSGFQYLTSLQEMVLQDMPEELMERLRGQDSVYIQHIVRCYVCPTPTQQ